jgi:Skp family chaperone for outer membrane proteins
MDGKPIFSEEVQRKGIDALCNTKPLLQNFKEKKVLQDEIKKNKEELQQIREELKELRESLYEIFGIYFF